MSRRAAGLFLALGLVWGIPYLLIKVALEEISPAQLVLARTGIAALVLMPIALAQGAVRPVLQQWRWLLMFATVEIAVPWVFLGEAETRLPSSTTGLLVAAVPLAGLAIAFATGRAERLTPGAWLGLTLGLVGVAALVGLDVSGSDLGAVAEVGVVVVGYAAGPAILSRPLQGLPGIGIMASALTVTALVYVPVVLASDGVPGPVPSGKVVWCVLALATVCTAAAFMLLFALVGEVGPVRATTITYLNPAVAVVAGAVFLGEQVTVWTVVGFVLVVSGSYLVNRRGRPARPAETDIVGAATPTCA
ncbi:MAG TPA: EamA family transporter [Nocardioides sp.]|uniref:DMT family transporter n=1 Tax=Nocardioides sp. TaxID=35761 RepID=UPI002E3010A1|nr:EamA family transporter [Nocardioides sp.]HEX3931899.1 EamA family transporter [Nocardioides sp.]